MLAAFAYQIVQIRPYTPLAKTEIDLVTPPHTNETVKLIAANVLMENTRRNDLIKVLEREDPDVVLLMETDAVWDKARQGLLGRYTTIKRHISNDYYGMIFATRLDRLKVDLLWPSNDTTPAIKATLTAPSGFDFNFMGLHPRPPVPGNTTAVRDKQIKEAAKMTASSERPTVCMGDFNDVTWSWITRRFKKDGAFLEPRVGHGMIPSFHAKYWLMRFPIDQLYLTKSAQLASFGRLSDKRRAVTVLHAIEDRLGYYLGGITIINSGLGVVIGAAMYLWGLPSVVVFGFMALGLNFVPFLGGLIGASIAAAVAFVSLESIWAATGVFVTYVTITSIQG